MCITTASKVTNSLFIPETVMIYEDKAFLHMNMHLTVCMYT